MENNEGLLNEWRDNTPIERELDPWLQSRLEERARPLNSGVPGIDKPTLISTSYQKLIRSTRESSRIVDSVMGRAGLASGVLQADKLSLFSRFFPGIITRTISTGTSNLYKMLNLPWFRPKRGNKTESVNDSSLVVRQEISEDSTDDINGTVILPVTESVEDNRREKLRKTPETYINYMISSPITRKTAMNIGNQDRNSALEKHLSLRSGRTVESQNLIDAEKNKHGAVRISGSTDKPTINKEEMPDRSGTRQDNKSTIPSRNLSYDKEDKNKEQIATTKVDIVKPDVTSENKDNKGNPIYPVKNLFYGKSLPVVRKIVQSLPFARNTRQKEIVPSKSLELPGDQRRTDQSANFEHVDNLESMSSNVASPGVKPVSTDLPVLPDVTRTAAKDSTINSEFQDTGYESHTFESKTLNKPVTSREPGTQANTSLVYPVKDLFYRKPITLTQRLIQSLPLIKNNQDKTRLSNETATQSTDRRQAGQSDNYALAKNLDRMSRNIDSPGVKPVNPDLPVSSDVTRTADKDFTINREFQDNGYESHTFESQTPSKSATSREPGTQSDASFVYPVKDLFYRKPITLAQRVINTLPLIKNHQDKARLSHETITQSTDRSQARQSDNFRFMENPEVIDPGRVSTSAFKPAQGLPLISRAITSAKSVSHPNSILFRETSMAGPDFIIPVDNSLDLTLAPVSRISPVQHREEYSRFDQSTVEPKIARSTQKIQRTETQQTETTDETQQTQTTDETQQTETSQETTTESQEESTGSNENMLDYRTIARETYPFIRRMIMVERERRPSR